MAAGLGFKTFTSGEVLTAADTNGYLMQGILVFASASARNAAITSPQEGQYCYLKDTNSTEYYDGAAWVSGVEGDISGVTAGVGISGGGTSGTVTVTNSMATAITTKGDLVPGTGSGTFSRLAVGANATMLVANSAEATGLKWTTATDQFPWTSYTPTLTAMTLGNGTLTASYQQIGKTVNVRILFTLGSTSAVSNFPRFSLPVNVDVPSAQVQIFGNVNFNDAGTTAYYGVVAYETASTVQVFAQDTTASTLQRTTLTATIPFTWTTSDQMLLNFSYLGV